MSKFSTVIFSTGCPHKPSVPDGNVCKFHENPLCRGRILGRNSDKSLESFCIWQKNMPPSLWFNYEIHTETSSLRTLKIMPRNINKIVSSWIRVLDLSECSRSVTEFLRYLFTVNHWHFQALKLNENPSVLTGQFILFSIVFTSLPQPPRQCLAPTCHLSILS